MGRYRTFALTLSFVILAATLAGCAGPAGTPTSTGIPTLAATPTPNSGLTPSPTPSITPMNPPPYENPLEFDITLAKSICLPNEEVIMELTFKNVGNETLELGEFPPEVLIHRPMVQASINTATWQSPAGSEKRLLSPGDSLTHEVIWNQRQLDGDLVDPGYYEIKAGLREVRWTQTGRVGNHFSYTRVLIQDPRGAIEKVFDTNQSQTVNGVVITIKRVELSVSVSKVYALAQPPDWSPPAPASSPAGPTPMLPPAPDYYPVPAQYSLDGGLMLDAGSAGFSWLEEGIGLIWRLIDPVPNGTEELTFVVNQFGLWPGPWEFHIPLQ